MSGPPPRLLLEAYTGFECEPSQISQDISVGRCCRLTPSLTDLAFRAKSKMS